MANTNLVAIYMHWLHTMHIAYWFLQMMMITVIQIQRRKMTLSRRRYVLDFQKNRKNLLERVYESDGNCMSLLRMDRRAFTILCNRLVEVGLRSSKHLLVDEQVAMFLEILAHHVKNRVIQRDFKRSAETISRYFHDVLHAVIRLQQELLKTPEPVPQDSTDWRWKWFKNCVGALDGTYIKVRVPLVDRPRYRNRKGELATNVLAVCSQDEQFIYVLPGWEGSAADGRVLRDALSRRNGLRVPNGCYYLVDAGYTNCEGFLAPYRGQRYHLNEWREGHQPRTPEEFFNMKHASARNVIERCFGFLKMRWGILRSPFFYPVKTQNRIIIACCLLHNFIRQVMETDPIEYLINQSQGQGQGHTEGESTQVIETSSEWNTWRTNLANEMYNEWRESRRVV